MLKLKGIFKKKNLTSYVFEKRDDLIFEISSDGDINITPELMERIIEIICDEIKEVKDSTGYIIAQRICESKEAIHRVDVDGGNGKNWKIKLSSFPF